jgi:hypothetical protein
MDRVPFSLPDVGLREVKGFAYLDDEFLIIEVESAVFGLTDRERQTVKVAPSALESVRFTRGLFRDRLRIKPEKVDLLKTIPGDHPSEIALRIPRKYRDLTERIADEMDDRIAFG